MTMGFLMIERKGIGECECTTSDAMGPVSEPTLAFPFNYTHTGHFNMPPLPREHYTA